MKLIYIILILTLLGFGTSIVFFKSVLTFHRKLRLAPALMYTLLAVSGAGSIRFLDKIKTADFWANYSIMQVVFLLIGILHVYLCVKVFFKNGKNVFILGTLYTVVLTILCTIALLVIYYFTNADVSFQRAVLSVLAFPIPFIIYYVFYFFRRIPKPIYTYWYYPVKEEDIPFIDKENFGKDSSYVLSLEISPIAKKFKTKAYRFNTPLSLQFGSFIFAALQEYNKKGEERIEVFDDNENPYGWEFLIKRPFFWQMNRRIDPKLNILQNNIKEKDIIVCKRVKVKEVAKPEIKKTELLSVT